MEDKTGSAFQFVLLTRAVLSQSVETFVNLIDGWPYLSWQADNFLYDLKSKWDFSFALYSEEHPVAFCIASEKPNRTYYVHLFFIADAYRRLGLGRGMIARMEELASQFGMDLIELRCPASNVGACQFYLRNGFQVVRKVLDEVSGDEPDYVLRRLIGIS